MNSRRCKQLVPGRLIAVGNLYEGRTHRWTDFRASFRHAPSHLVTEGASSEKPSTVIDGGCIWLLHGLRQLRTLPRLKNRRPFAWRRTEPDPCRPEIIVPRTGESLEFTVAQGSHGGRHFGGISGKLGSDLRISSSEPSVHKGRELVIYSLQGRVRFPRAVSTDTRPEL